MPTTAPNAMAPTKVTPQQRLLMHEAMRLLIAHEPQVHYRQFRPMQTVKKFSGKTVADLRRYLAGGGELELDCSESATLICLLAGVNDPNNFGYDGRGYTGTLLANPHLQHYTPPAGANIGALVVFGPPPGEHVCTVYEPGRDPLLFSHGQERGPLAIRYSAEERFHHHPATFLTITALGGLVHRVTA